MTHFYQRTHVRSDFDIIELLRFARQTRDEILREMSISRLQTLELFEYEDCQTKARVYMLDRDALNRANLRRV